MSENVTAGNYPHCVRSMGRSMGNDDFSAFVRGRHKSRQCLLVGSRYVGNYLDVVGALGNALNHEPLRLFGTRQDSIGSGSLEFCCGCCPVTWQTHPHYGYLSDPGSCALSRQRTAATIPCQGRSSLRRKRTAQGLPVHEDARVRQSIQEEACSQHNQSRIRRRWPLKSWPSPSRIVVGPLNR